MPNPVLWAAIPTIASTAAKAFTKPREEDFTPRLNYLKRYKGFLKGEQARDEVYNMAIRPQVRRIGAQGRRSQRMIDYTANRQDAGFGQEASARLRASRDTQMALEQAGEHASALQAKADRRYEDRIQGVEMEMGRLQEQGKQRYNQALNQWKTELATTAAQGAANIAGAYAQQFASDRAALEAAKAQGMVDPQTTVGQFRKQAQESGFTDVKMYAGDLQRRETEGQMRNTIEYFAGDRVDEIPDDIPINAQMKLAEQFYRERQGDIESIEQLQAQYSDAELQEAFGEDADLQAMAEAGEISPAELGQVLQSQRTQTYLGLVQREDLDFETVVENMDRMSPQQAQALTQRALKLRGNQVSDFTRNLFNDFFQGKPVTDYLNEADTKDEFRQATNLLMKQMEARQQSAAGGGGGGLSRPEQRRAREAQMNVFNALAEVGFEVPQAKRGESFDTVSTILQGALSGEINIGEHYPELQQAVKDLSQKIEPPQSAGDASEMFGENSELYAIWQMTQGSQSDFRGEFYDYVMGEVEDAFANPMTSARAGQSDTEYPGDPFGEFRVQ